MRASASDGGRPPTPAIDSAPVESGLSTDVEMDNDPRPRLLRRPPKVSVIMSLFNVEGSPLPGLESILAQDFDDYEIVVVNDGATDRTGEILDEYARRDNRVRVVHSAVNLKLAGALNLAICHARAEILMRMDHDDWSPPHRMARQYAFLAEHPNVGLVSCAFDRLRSDGTYQDTVHLPTTHAGIVRRLTRGPSGMCHPGTMVRRSCFLRFGFYNPALVRGQDYDLWLRWRSQITFANLDEVLLRYQLPPVQWEPTRGVTYWQMYRAHTLAWYLNLPGSRTKIQDLYGVLRMHAFYLIREPIRRAVFLLRQRLHRP
jgi:glycosyltransferase involved in cell wall biosynthesis